MLLKEIMRTDLVTIAPEANIREAARKMRDENVGCVLITEGGRLRGCLTDRDIACWLAEGKDPDNTEVRSIMKERVITATPETDVLGASRTMSINNVRRLPIVEDGKLCGMVTTADLAPVLEEEVDNFFHLEEAYQH